MTPTNSAFLGGKLMLLQPEKGHRVGTDAALLAACVAPGEHATVFDLGAGVGAAGLAVAIRAPAVRVRLVEVDADIAQLAGRNIEQNRLGERVSVIRADVTAPLRGGDDGLSANSADFVIMNPPFHLPGTVRPPPGDYRHRAHIHGPGGDEAWVRCAHALLRPRGELAIIHRADALSRLLAALDRRFGGIRIKPVLSKPDALSIRVLVRAVKASRAPLALLPALVMHDAGGAFTPQADALHRGDLSIDWLDR